MVGWGVGEGVDIGGDLCGIVYPRVVNSITKNGRTERRGGGGGGVVCVSLVSEFEGVG